MIGSETDKHNVKLNVTYKKRILHKQSNSPMSDTLTQLTKGDIL